MPSPDSTRWTLIRQAADGDTAARDAFARRYEPVVHAYLGARWRHSPLRHESDDAAQEVFLACFREDGALERADPDRGEFRGFLYGVVRNVARRFEERHNRNREHDAGSAFEAPADDEALSVVFDRAWALALIRRATALHARRAAGNGDGAARRADLLRLRFRDGLPIREIARRWDEEPAHLHHEYAAARKEFVAALFEVVREETDGTPRQVKEECSRLAGYLR
jgi:RNA polymerase sigma factor (sigma-70 family)